MTKQELEAAFTTFAATIPQIQGVLALRYFNDVNYIPQEWAEIWIETTTIEYDYQNGNVLDFSKRMYEAVEKMIDNGGLFANK